MFKTLTKKLLLSSLKLRFFSNAKMQFLSILGKNIAVLLHIYTSWSAFLYLSSFVYYTLISARTENFL